MLSKFHFAHNTILSLNNVLLYCKEYFTILEIGQVSSCLQYPFLFFLFFIRLLNVNMMSWMTFVTVSFSSICHVNMMFVGSIS